MRVSRAAYAMGVVVLLGSPLRAQDWKGQGRLEGRVVDAEGKPVEGATVKLDNPARGGGPTVKTDKKGRWAYLGLVSGYWNIDIEAAGFATRQVKASLPSEGARLQPLEIRLERARPAGPPPELLKAIEGAEAAYEAGRYEEALAEYEKVLALRPDLATTVHHRLGFTHIRLKNYDKALEHLQKVADAEPANVQVRTIMAQAALEGGMIERGRELLKAVDASAIKDPDVFFNIAVNFLNANQPEDAIVYFGRAVAVDPAYVDGYYRRALAYLQTGQLDAAKADFRKVLELAPDGAQADASRKALEQLK